MAEIGRLKKGNDVKLVCLKRENKLKGLFEWSARGAVKQTD
jgi:hypothetical protein